jgi:hypothetical protein
MISLYEELSGKIAQAPGSAKRNLPRQDLGLLLFAEREAINRLWKAAERRSGPDDGEASGELRDAVEKLRSMFGEREG